MHLAPLMIVSLLFTAWPPCAGAETGGLDVAVLVDVSFSMYGKERNTGVADGSDPQRLRWDAVKLVADLLTDEDRLLVLPFNDRAPASYRDQPVPRVFPSGFQPLRQSLVRADLETLIFASIHEQLKIDDAYADEGGTSILGALDAARARMREDRQRIGRLNHQVVILLTDGKEDVKGQPDADKLAELFEHAAGLYRDDGVRVFTIGLGDDVDAERLQSLSAITGGSYLHAKTNENLIVFFRDLIWSLKGNWIWRTEQFRLGAGERRSISSRPLRGVTDVGVLCYEMNAEAKPPRTTYAPSPLPRLSWRGAKPGNRELNALARGGKVLEGRTTGYCYFYCDGRATGGDPLGSAFQENGDLQFELEFEKVAGPTSVFVVKRVQPVFRLELAGSRFFRHQPIPVSVPLDPSGEFAATDFEVVASLHRPDQKGEPRSVQLVADAGSDRVIFRGGERPLTAESLLSDGGDIDSYVVSVRIRGKEDRTHALSGFEFALPPRMIQILNVMPLRHRPSEILLSRRQVQQTVDLESVFANTSEEIPLRLRLQQEPRAANGSKLEGVRLEFPEQVVLRAGRAQFPVVLTANVPPSRKADAQAILVATADTSATVKVAPESSDDRQYPIPVRVVLDDIKLVVTPKQVRLHVGSEQSQASTAVTVDLSAPDETGRDVDSLLLEIRQSGTGPAFSPDELWVQAAGPPLTVDQRAQKYSVPKPGTPLQVYYQPRPRANVVGSHRCSLVAQASGFPDSEAFLDLEVGPPEIVVRDPNAGKGMRGVPGALTTVTYQVKMLWLRDGVWTFSAEPGDRGAAEFVFARSTDANVDDGGRFTAALRSSNVLQLKAAEGRPEDTWTDLALTFEVPPAATEGSYFHEVALRDSRVEYKRLAVELNIRPLQIEFRPTVVDLRAELDNKFTATTPFAVTLVNPNEPTVGTGQLKLELKPGDEQAASFGVDEIWIQTVADPLPASDRSRSLVLEGLATPLFAFFHPKSTTRLELSDVPLRFELSCEGEGFGAARGAIDAVLAPPVFQFTREMAAIHTCRSSESVELVNGLRVFWIARAPLSFVPDQQVRFVPSQEPPFPEAAPFDAVVNGSELNVESVDPRADDAATTPLRLPVRVPSGKQAGRYAGAIGLRHAGRSYATLPVEMHVNELVVAFPVLGEQLQETFGAVSPPQPTTSITLCQFFDHPAVHTLVVRNALHEPLDVDRLDARFEKNNAAGVPLLYHATGDVVQGPAIKKTPSAPPGEVLITLEFPPLSHGETDGPYSGQLLIRYDKETEQGKIDYGQAVATVNLHLVDLRAVQIK